MFLEEKWARLEGVGEISEPAPPTTANFILSDFLTIKQMLTPPF